MTQWSGRLPEKSSAEEEFAQRIRAMQQTWLQDVMRAQDGVVTWSQLVRAGLTRADIARGVRRKELRRVHPRVYVDHTGPLTWRQRAWAAVLYAAPAVLCWDSVEPPRKEGGNEPIHVAIDQSRRIHAREGIVIHRMTGLDKRRFGGSPPRLRLEDNAFAMAHEAQTQLEVIALLARVASKKFVTAGSLRSALARFPTMRRRRWIASLIDDLASGTCSVLEHGYLTAVERAHGLPEGTRQAPRATAEGQQFRDVEYQPYGLVVELDGRLGHDSWDAQGRDADRDLDDLALAGMPTARLRWRQVFGTPCRTADRIGRILQRLGWSGAPRPCPTGCSIAS